MSEQFKERKRYFKICFQKTGSKLEDEYFLLEVILGQKDGGLEMLDVGPRYFCLQSLYFQRKMENQLFFFFPVFTQVLYGKRKASSVRLQRISTMWGKEGGG